MLRIFGDQPRPCAFVGRPYLVWRNNLDLARMVNERLAAAAQIDPHRIGTSGANTNIDHC
jgi:hypothetical protein